VRENRWKQSTAGAIYTDEEKAAYQGSIRQFMKRQRSAETVEEVHKTAKKVSYSTVATVAVLVGWLVLFLLSLADAAWTPSLILTQFCCFINCLMDPW
jgi:hypothetical protein